MMARLPALLTTLGMVFLAVQTALSQVELPDLDYDMDALEPYISEETVEYHYGKHHASYVSNLNAFIEEDSSLENLTAAEIMMITTGTVFNNAAQVYNHNFYWKSISPDGGGSPEGDLLEAIEESFGSWEIFKSNFTTSGSGHFGSGWAWLVQADSGGLEVVDTHDASNPLVEALGTPLLTYDVWEHAYYIDYRNGRSDYIDGWWSLVNWDYACENFSKSNRGRRSHKNKKL